MAANIVFRGMTSTIVDAYGNDLYYCGYTWGLSLLVWATQWNDIYLLWILMGMTSTIVG